MPLFKAIAGLSLAGLIVAVGLQKLAISNARQENQAARQIQAEALQLAGENQSVPELRQDTQPLDDLRLANQDLLKLRNEVRQLRAQIADVEELRRDNQRLASTIKTLSSGKTPRLSDMEGYVPKETWSHSGFATPEAALQTFLWAVREGRIQAVAECMSPESPHFEAGFARKSEEEQKKSLQEDLGQLVKTGGYRLVDREEAADDKVVLGIQAVAGGLVAKVVLRRFGNEWKFHDVESIK
jgi:hypothetical protein